MHMEFKTRIFPRYDFTGFTLSHTLFYLQLMTPLLPTFQHWSE
jgi:hypothetical protein